MIGCVSPCVKDTQQTLNTLRYAESLSPNTGKRPSIPKMNSSAAVNELEDDEEDGVNMRMSRLVSISLMDDEFKDDADEDSMSLI